MTHLNDSHRPRRAVGLATAAVVMGSAVALAAAPALAAPSAVTPCTSSTSSGSYPPGSAQIGIQQTAVVPGQQDTVSSNGWQASSTVQLYLCSTPYALGSAQTDARGTFTKVITIPADVSTGAHHVEAIGVNPQGQDQVLVTQVTVVPSAATGASGSTSSTLPFTGLDLVPLVLAAIALVVVGGSLVVVARRRIHPTA